LNNAGRRACYLNSKSGPDYLNCARQNPPNRTVTQEARRREIKRGESARSLRTHT